MVQEPAMKKLNVSIKSFFLIIMALSSVCLAHEINHFMYVSRDRELIHDRIFLTSPQLKGAQVMYAWKDLERSPNHYDFSVIQEDIDTLAKHGKKLFIQLQDTTFLKSNKALPAYLLSPKYNNGVVPQCDSQGKIYGWVGKRWDPKVKQRFQALIRELGKSFDGKIAGINLQETSIQVDECTPKPRDFTDTGYRDAVKDTMTILSQSFKSSLKMQYANFMTGEWLPWDDKGYLRSVYEHAKNLKVAIGAPDLLPQRKGMINHAYKLMKDFDGQLIKGVAIQDGNYHGSTGSAKLPPGKIKNRISSLFSYAKSELKVKYLFWVKQEPYFTEQVIPFLKEQK